MNVLITNDDGIESQGLKALARELATIGNVTVVAPAHEKSGSSQSLTIHGILWKAGEHKDGDFSGYSVDGTPADCVKYALANLVNTKPDIIVSGINKGPNNSLNILYSGTVGAALEGVANGIPAVAVSLINFHSEDYSTSAKFTKEFILKLFKNGKPNVAVYNINVPAVPLSDIKGVKFTKMAQWQYFSAYEARIDPFGKPYYWLAGFNRPEENEKGTDDDALSRNYISVTPIKIDMTDYTLLDKLKLMEGEQWL